MFSKLSLVALIAPLVSGLVLQVPQNPTSGGTVTISWTNQQGDPSTWSFELVNVAFHNSFAIANNIDPSLNSITIQLPVVPIGDGYTLEAVNIGNISDIFATTGDFSIANGTSTSTSTPASSSTSSVTSETATTKGTASSVSVTTSTSTSTSAPFTSVIVSSTAPASSSTGAATTTSSGAATTSSSAALSSHMSLGGPIGGFAVAILSAAAGVAMIAL